MVVECQISSDDCEIIGDCDKQGIECDGVTAFLLTAEGHFSRPVSVTLLKRLGTKFSIQQGRLVHTICRDVVVLDQLINYLKGLSISEEIELPSLLNLLDVAEFHDLDDLWHQILPNILQYSRQDPIIALKTYLAMRDVIDRMGSKLYAFLDELNQIYPIFIVFESDEDRFLLGLAKSKAIFERIPYVFNIKRMDAEKQTEAIWVDSVALPLIIAHIEDGLDVKTLDDSQLQSVISSCYRLGYRQLFREAIMKLEGVTETMADDLFDFYLLSHITHSDVVRAFDCPAWRSGEMVLVYVFKMRRGRGRGQAAANESLDQCVFLPRDLLKEKLKIYLSRHTMYQLSKNLSSPKIVDHLRRFLQDEHPLKDIKDLDELAELLQLSACLEYDDMYFQVAMTILKQIEFFPFPKLHNQIVTEDTLEDYHFVTLKAADESRIRIHRTKLKDIPIFDSILSLNEEYKENLEIDCLECKDKEVLEAWADFLVGGEASKIESSLFVYRSIEIERIVIELLHVADFYIDENLLKAVLKWLPLHIDPLNVDIIYNALPTFSKYAEVDEASRLIESKALPSINISARFLNKSPVEFLEATSYVANNVELFKVVDTYTNFRIKNPTWSNENVVIEKPEQFLNLPLIYEYLHKLENPDPELLDLCSTLLGHNSLSILATTPPKVVLFNSQAYSNQITFFVLEENTAVKTCRVHLKRTLGISKLSICIIGKKLVIWNPEGKTSIVCINTRREIELPSPGQHYSFVYWQGKFVAFCRAEGDHLILNEDEGKWMELTLSNRIPLIGNPLVIGDRLYVLSNNTDDWILYIKELEEPIQDADDDNLQYKYAIDFVCPAPRPERDPMNADESPHQFPLLKEREICESFINDNRIYLIRYDDVLLYDTTDLRLEDRHELTEGHILDTINLNEQVICLHSNGNSPVIYKLNLSTWKRELFSTKETYDFHFVYNKYGFVRNN